MKKRFNVFIFLVIICVLTLTFAFAACNSDDEQDTVKDMELAQGHEHKWDAGVVTTLPTCITPGVITYSCEHCDAQKKEPLDANGEHLWSDYSHDEDFHWRVCRICGELDKHAHDFGDKTIDSNANDIMECECGIYKTVGEFYSYKVAFECGVGISAILVYDTQTYIDGVESTAAYARDSSTGKLLNDGEGQVNFEVVVAIGYKLKSVSVTPKTGYKNLKDPSETSRENTYRITKITDELVVTVDTEIDFLELPVMVINTQNSAPILDKENYVTCNISVLNAEQEYCFEGESAGIRGRGNTTWGMPKKPYRVKFDSKIDLFGNGKAKSWTLIANYCDPSLIRNYLAYSIGAEFASLKDTTTTVQMVELYLNGQYEGVYLLCEQVQVGANRVDISEEIEDSNGEELLDTGYLIELDSWEPLFYLNDTDYGDRYFGTSDKTYYCIKSPDIDDFDKSNLDYNKFLDFIKNYLDTCMKAISSDDYSSVEELMDVDSFAEAYIVNELFNNKDVGQSSFFMYKKAGDKLYCGPIWDFDVSSGNCNYNDTVYQEHGSWEYDCLWAKELNIWFFYLLRFEEFQNLVANKLNIYRDIIIGTITQCIDRVVDSSNSFERNFIRWNVLGTYIWPNPEEIVAIDTWQGQVKYVRDWLYNSLDYMLSVYCSD